MINRPPTSSLRARLLGLAASGLVIASVMLVPASALAAPGAPPNPQPDTITTLEDVAATGNVLANDLNPGEGTLTVVAPFPTLSATIGTLDVAANGDYTFTPTAGWNGTASTTYNVANDKHTRSAAINIVVTNVEDAPVANDDTIAVTEDTATDVTSAIKANDTDLDNDPLTVTAVSGASGGSVSLTAGVATFTPDANLCGDGAGGFDYTISDGQGGTDSAHVTVDVTCVDDAPHAVNDSASGTEDTDVVISGDDLVSNDTDVENDTLHASAVSNPTGGSVDLTSGTVTFTPDADLCGNNAAGFDYTVSDGNGGTDTGHVTIDLTCTADAPVASDDTVTVAEDSADNDVTADLLANDSDPDGDTLTITSADNATGGSVDLTAGVVTFTPNANICGDGAGSFDYTIDDGDGGTDSAQATVDVTCDNDAPVAGDDSASGAEDADVVVNAADLLGNDTDVENDTLTVTGVSNPTGGTVDLTAGVITFTPDADLCGDGAAGFDYTVDDGNGGTDTGHVTIDLDCVNDNPVATDDSAAGTEDTDVSIDAADLLANDTDTENDTLTVTGVLNPVGGTVDLTAGTITFTPDADLCGTGVASFDYTVDDGNGGTDTGTVTIDLTCENDNPVAVDDDYQGTEDTDFVVTDAELLANDTDADGDTLTVTGVTNPVGGTVSLDAGTITYTPDANACGNIGNGFDYTISDGNGGTDTGYADVDLTCVNDDPVANADTVNVDENSAANDVTAAILANDTDVDNLTLVVSAVSNPTGGTVDLTAGVVTFTPDADLCGNGEGGFDYTVSDGDGGLDDAHVTVDINCVSNDPPVAVDDSASGTEDTDLVVTQADMVGNDTDPNSGNTLSVSEVTNPTGGTVVLDGDTGDATFTPDADLCGDDVASFDYTVIDGEGGSDTGTVTISLECVNDAPVGVDDTATVAQASAGADYSVLDNDTDTENDVLSVTLVSVSPLGAGTVTTDGTVVHFTPAPSFHGTAVITYTLSDGDLTDTATLTITVTAETVPPVVTAASVRFGSGRVDQSAPLVISWSAVDALSGVVHYDVQVSVGGAAFRPVYSGTGTSVQKFYPFKKSLVFRVRATDGAGNTSGWAQSAKRKIKTFQNSNRKIEYTGDWKQVHEPAASGAGYAWTDTFHGKVKLSFSGRAVLYVTTKMKPAGHVNVYVDGHLIGNFNLHAKHTKLGRIIARWSSSSNASHTIRIVNATTGKRLTFDTFVVLK